MKADKEIAAEAMTWFVNSKEESFAAACEKAVALTRQYGALAPAAPLSFVQQAAIAAMQGMLAQPITDADDEDTRTPANISFWAVEHALALEAALKKGGAA